MTAPLEPNPFTALPDPLYGNVAKAHEAIEAAGFYRDNKAHIWRHQDGRTAKAVRVQENKAIVVAK
jgi:hypothetical protein